MRRVWLLMSVVLTACGGATAARQADGNTKWFVCKYVDKPGEDERLQTGQNPISVSENAFPAGVTPAVGVEFNDAQGRSLIIAEDVGQPEPSPSDCPPPNTTTTTTSTTEVTTSTSSSSTTTSTTAPPSTSSSTTSTTAPPSPTTTTSSLPPTSTTTATPPPSIDFAFLGPVCVQDHPFIGWVITPHNVPGALTATITIRDINGVVVKQLFNQPLTGQTLWPGATIDPDDWPGWIKVGDVWVEDPTDAVVRQGVFVTAEVNPEATGFVTYPPATSACASPTNPPGVIPPPAVPPPAVPPVAPPGLPPTL